LSKGAKIASAVMQELVCFNGPRFRGHFNFSFVWALACAATVCAGADSAVSAVDKPSGSFEAVDITRLDVVQSWSALAGRKVRDLNDHAVGKLEDVLVDLSRGEILAAIISPGGSGVIPVPPATFHSASKEKILVDADQKLFQGAPHLSEVRSGVQSDLPQTYRHFKQPVPEPALAARLLVSAAVLAGKPVFGSANEMLGQVQDVVLDLPVGRVVYVTIQPSAGHGTDGKLFVVPPAALNVDGSGKLSLPANRERFVAGPYFQKAFSSDILDGELLKSIYSYYSPLPVAAQAKSGQTAVPASSVTQAVTPIPASAPARSDSEITKAVMMEILNEGKVALRGDVQITTHQGRVKLAGTARNEREKQCVLEAARKVAGPGFVDDTLLVKGKNTTVSSQ